MEGLAHQKADEGHPLVKDLIGEVVHASRSSSVLQDMAGNLVHGGGGPGW